MSEPLHVTKLEGGGPLVVFLHGLFGQGRNFWSIAKTLQPEYAALLVDLPNHGSSPWVDEVDYIAMADAVAETIGHESPSEPVVVVGHSMGGKVAMLLALRHPHLVSALVVVDIAPDARAGTSEFEHLLGSLATLDLATIERRGDADRSLESKIPDRTVRSFLLQNLRHTSEGWKWRANLEVLRRDLSRVGDFPEDPAGQPYEGPVLWVAGSESTHIQERHFAKMRALFPSYRRVVVKGAGHWVHSEQPEVFTDVLIQFLGTAARK